MHSQLNQCTQIELRGIASTYAINSGYFLESETGSALHGIYVITERTGRGNGEATSPWQRSDTS